MTYPALDIDEFLSVLPLKRSSPHHDAAAEHTVQWAKDFGIVQSQAAVEHLELTDTAACAVLMHPDTISEVTACDLADMYTIFYVVDDYIDEGPLRAEPEQAGEILADVMRGLGGTAPRSPAGIALADVFERVTEGYPLVRRRARMGFTNYLREISNEAADRAERRRNDLMTHIDRRRAASAVAPYMELTQPCLGFELPDWLYSVPDFRRVIDASIDISHWCSDLVSARRDGPDEAINIVNRIRDLTGGDLSSSWDNAKRMLHARIRFLDKQISQLHQVLEIGGCEDGLRDRTVLVAENMRDWATGSLQWYKSASSRYQTTQTCHEDQLDYFQVLPFREDAVFQW
ncbi:hypothetical protein ABZV91_16645 [Nocardia sp. NPDC004568]|uniref:terpene synthase family protein n=1 Tax=Nocardia sp. NPDC004568 TaxID=3154551 RepID=UPI0033ADD6B7